MWVYLAMFLVPTLAVLFPKRLPRRQAAYAWAVTGLLFALVIGTRHEIGSDWFNYLRHVYRVEGMTFGEVLRRSDPGYYALNWIVTRLGGGIYWVNFLSACVVVWGTINFSRKQPNPWLALMVAVPYLLIVVGMGYTRQAVALGFSLVALGALGESRVRAFVVWVVIGALFHKSAVLLLPIAALAASRNRLLTISLVGIVTVMTYFLLLEESADELWATYVEAAYHSEGGLIRVLMNVVPAILIFSFRAKLVPNVAERRLWLWIAAFALACLPLVNFASTAVDRVALYAIPLQLFVFSRLPQLVRTSTSRTVLTLAILGYYAAVLLTWLILADNAKSWVPYKSVLM